MDQRSLFDDDRPPYTPKLRSDAPETSVWAADAISGDVDNLRAQVYRVIYSRGEDGATDQEVQEVLGLDGNTQRPRRQELQDVGLVVKSGQTRIPRTRKKYNRAAIVWVVNKFAPNPPG